MSCPQEDLLLTFAEGQLGPSEASEVRDHLDGCDECRMLIGAAARVLPAAVLAPGGRVGRYVVLKRLGAGQMGVVHAAYDPDLDRNVALKLLKSDQQEGLKDRAERMMREAKALARLSHPQVTQVYDVGVHQGQVFIATELVVGTTLREWLRESPRSQREIVSAFQSAGEGLAAAHRAGLVHRDFKPDNVLVALTGEVRVTDFGLARAGGEPSATGNGARPSEDAAAYPMLTQTGALVGTPAYMAPEQFRGAPGDAWSDQFGFCVAFYEALFGRRPYEARTVGELERAVRAGPPLTSIPGRAVSGWLTQIVLRGLRAERAERYPSMDELLRALAEAENRHLVSRLSLARLAGVLSWLLLDILAQHEHDIGLAMQLPAVFAYSLFALGILLLQPFAPRLRHSAHFAIALCDVPFIYWAQSRLAHFQLESGKPELAAGSAAFGLAMLVSVVAFAILSFDFRAVAATAGMAIVLEAVLTLGIPQIPLLGVAMMVTPLLVVGAVGTFVTHQMRRSSSQGRGFYPPWPHAREKGR